MNTHNPTERPEPQDLIKEAYRNHYTARTTTENRPRRTWRIAVLSFGLFIGDYCLFMAVPAFATDTKEAAGCFFVFFLLQVASFTLGVEATLRRIK